MKKNQKLEYSLEFSKLFFMTYLIYNVNYKFMLGIPSTYIVITLTLIYFFICSFYKKIFYLKINSSVFFSTLLLIWSLISLMINNEKNDFYLIRISLLYFIIILLFPFIYKIVFKKNVLLLLKTIGFVGLINGIFIISMFIIKPFQELYLTLINQTTFDLVGGNSAIDSAMSLRMIGITGFSAYSTSFVQMLCAICFLLFIYYKDNKKLKMQFKDVLILIFIIFSALISARSAILGIFIFILIYIKISNIKQSLKFIVSLFSLLSIFIITIINFIPNEFKDFFINWITEFFVSGSKTGSLQANINMFIYDWIDFSLTGDSRWFGNNNDYYMNTDVGWYRILFSIGYVGLSLWLLAIISIIGWKNLFSLNSSNKICIMTLIFTYVLIMTFKGAILFDSFQSIFILLSISLIVSISEKQKIT